MLTLYENHSIHYSKIIFAIFIGTILIACNQQQSPVPDSRETENFIPIPQFIQTLQKTSDSCGLQAWINIDDDAPLLMAINDGQASYTFPDISLGTYQFSIEFKCQTPEVTLATNTISQEIKSGSNQVDFKIDDYTLPDDDQDNVNNLTEINLGRNPLVLNPPLKPNVNVNTLGASVLFSSDVVDAYTARYNLLAYRSLNSNPDTLAENISDSVISIPYSGHQMLITEYVIEACNLTCSRSERFSIQQNMLDQLAYIKGFSSENNDHFGFSVALSADGNTLAVGAFGESGAENNAQLPSADVAGGDRPESGGVFVYKRVSGVWISDAYIKAFSSQAGDRFGRSVTLSADGTTLVVGAYWEAGGQNGVQLPSADDADTSTPLSQSGAVYVYQRENGGWKNDAYIKAFNSEIKAWFGRIVTLSGDGNILAVGAYGEDGGEDGIPLLPVVDGAVAKAVNSGAVYLYNRVSGVWKIDAYIKAFSSEAGDEFGRAVLLSADGTTLAVGAYLESGGKSGVQLPSADDADPAKNRSGAMYVYQQVNGVWQSDAYIKAFSSATQDWFGMSAALSADGTTLAVGAHRERGAEDGVLFPSADVAGDTGEENSGAVYVYKRADDGVWQSDAYIKAFNSEAGDEFGRSVTLSADGNILAVGAVNENGAKDGVQLPSVDDADAGEENSGAVYVYKRVSGVWQSNAYIKAFSSEAGDSFGRSVRLSDDGNTLAVGAFGESGAADGVQSASVDGANADAPSSGAVFVY